MYSFDNSWKGFEWLDADNKEQSTYSFVRKKQDGKDNLLFVLNMTPMLWKDFRVGVYAKAKYKLLLNSDYKKYGGNGAKLPRVIEAEEIPYNGKKYSLSFDLAPYMAAVFVF